MNLRERTEKLAQELYYDLPDYEIDRIEAALLETRNETLEEAAKQIEQYGQGDGYSFAAKIRALKEKQ